MSSKSGHNIDPGIGNSPPPGLPATSDANIILAKAKSIGYQNIEPKDLPDKYWEGFAPVPKSIPSLTDLMLKLGMTVYQGGAINGQYSGISSIADCVANDVLQNASLTSNLNNIGETTDVLQSVKDMASNYVNIDSPEGQQVVQQAYEQVSNNPTLTTEYSLYNQGLNSIVDNLRTISFINFNGGTTYNEVKGGVTKTEEEIRRNYSSYVSSVREKEREADPEAVITEASKDFQVYSAVREMAQISDRYQNALNDLILDMQRAAIQKSANDSTKVSYIRDANATIAIISSQFEGRYKQAYNQSKLDVSDLPEEWRP